MAPGADQHLAQGNERPETSRTFGLRRSNGYGAGVPAFRSRSLSEVTHLSASALVVKPSMV